MFHNLKNSFFEEIKTNYLIKEIRKNDKKGILKIKHLLGIILDSIKENYSFYKKDLIQNLTLKTSYFFKKYIYTTNHKRIALNYFYFSLIMGLIGAFLALIIRMELAHPGSPFLKGNSLLYLQVITSHGIIMIFFVVVPIIFGFFGNFLIPLHIGSKDVAYPRLNSIGFWILPVGFTFVCKAVFLRHKMWKPKEVNDTLYLSIFNSNHSLYKPLINKENIVYINPKNSIRSKFIDNIKVFNNKEAFNKDNITSLYNNLRWEIREFTENIWSFILSPGYKVERHKIYLEKNLDNHTTCTGWTFITPFSSNIEKSAIGPIDSLIIAVLLSGISTTIGFINLLVTRRTLSMPGLNNRRFLIPFISIGILLSLRFLALITPILGGCMIMIFTDRHWGTAFFDFAYGGDPIFSQHLFWFFGHPEVYVLIIPTFGIINMVIPYSSYRRITSKQHMIWAIYVMGYMGFLVWGHHMYLVGLDHRARTLYSTITVMISLPATIKIISWTLSILNSPLKVTFLTIFSIIYIFFFLVSGLTGMWLSHIVLNITLHDTYYVVAHFHFMLSATAILGLMTGFYYYFNTFFNIRLSKTFIWLHITNFTLGHLLTFIPQFMVGVAGMPRRVNDYPDIFASLQGFSTSGYLITLLGVLFFIIVILDSHIKNKVHKVENFLPRVNNRVNYLYLKLSN